MLRRRSAITGSLLIAARCAPVPAPEFRSDRAPKRVALVIGNGAYKGDIPRLANPPKDAVAIAATLQRLRFQVDLLEDCDLSAMKRAADRLGAAAEDADAALVFYAGHAAEVGGANLLFPVSVNLTATALLNETFELDTLLASVQKRGRPTLIFLDSCRDNPFRGMPVTTAVRNGGPIAGATRSVGAGLASISTTADTLIVFATAPGNVALDGSGEHSPFTTALLKHLDTPDLEVREMMSQVRRTVREETDGKQIPWDNSSLETSFFFSHSVDSAIFRRALAYASSHRIPMPANLPDLVDQSEIRDRSPLVGVWAGAYSSGREVMLAIFSVDAQRQRADVLFAEGASTNLSSPMNINKGQFFRALVRLDDLTIRRGDGWSYKLVLRGNDEAEIQSIRRTGIVDAGAPVRKLS